METYDNALFIKISVEKYSSLHDIDIKNTSYPQHLTLRFLVTAVIFLLWQEKNVRCEKGCGLWRVYYWEKYNLKK